MSISPAQGSPVAVGDSFKLSAQVDDQNGSPIANVRLSWTSSDSSVATIDQQGWVRVMATGSTTIAVTFGGLRATADLVTWGEISGRVLVDDAPVAGFAVQLGGIGSLATVTDSLGQYRFQNLRPDDHVCIRGPSSPGCYAVNILGEGFGFDLMRFGFQKPETRVSAELGAVTTVDFGGYSIPECETHPLIKLEFVNNDPVLDGYWRSAVCRWANIVTNIHLGDCSFRSYDGVVITIEYVDDREDAGGLIGFCNGSPWSAHFTVARSDEHFSDPQYWLVPPQTYSQVSTWVASALGIFIAVVPALNEQLVDGYFIGAQASIEFQTIGGEGHPQISTFGPDRNKMFWREDEMCNEMFGPSIWAGTAQPISAVTVAALEDIGVYEVNRDMAEPFFPYDCAPGADAAHGAPIRVIHLRSP